MSHGYAVGSALSGLAAGSFTWSSGYTSDRSKLNDTLQDEIAAGSSSAQASGQTLAWDLGSAQALVGVALLGHNLASGACAVKVEGADDSGFSVNLVTAKAASTITTTAPNDRDTVLQFPSVTKRYWRLTFTHSGTKIIKLGEVLALAAITTLSRTKAYGHGETERYLQNRNDSPTGSVRSTLLSGPVRTKRIPFKEMAGTAQRDELLSMWRACLGGVLPLLWIETIESSASAATSAGMECLWTKMNASIDWTESDFTIYDVSAFELMGQGREVI